MGGGKALRDDQLVLTPTGWVKISDLKFGDEVMTPDNEVTNVTGVYPQGKVDLYEVTLLDGRKSICCGDHLWECWDARRAKRTVRKTSELIERIKHINVLLPTVDEMDYLSEYQTKLPLDAYVLGALLGDGGMSSDSVSFTTADEFFIKEFTKLGIDIVKRGTKDYSYGIRGLMPVIRSLDLKGVTSHTKFIPDIYKTASIQDRKNLIQGLMDTDGYISKEGKLYYYTVSEQLAKDFQEVIRSLGGSATITDKYTKYNGKLVKSYSVYIKYNKGKELVRLPRKMGLARTKKTHTGIRIKSIEKVESGDATCISVACPKKLFITNDFIVTHNTYGILLDNLLYINDPNYFSVFFRRTLVELKTNLFPEMLRLAEPFLFYQNGPNKGKPKGKAHISLQDYTITWPSGAKTTCAYLDLEKDSDKWYGAEISRAYFDEFQFTREYCFDVIRSRMRSKAKIKSCIRCTLNPDDSHFCYNYVRIFLDEEGFPIPEYSGREAFFLIHDGVTYTAWTKQELIDKFPEKEGGIKNYTYIPSTLEDNAILMNLEADYKATLDSLPEAKRKQLLLGCWHASQSEGEYFRKDWVKMVNGAAENATRCRAWDIAGVEHDPNSTGYAKNPDWTAGVLMSKRPTPSGVPIYRVEDVIRDRKSIGDIVSLIIQISVEDAELYGDKYSVFIPSDPNPSATAFAKEIVSKLVEKGIKAYTSSSRDSKIDRYLPFSCACQNDQVEVTIASWNKEYFLESEKLTSDRLKQKKQKDDQVDATSDAFIRLNNTRVVPVPTLPSSSQSLATRLDELRKDTGKKSPSLYQVSKKGY